MTNKHVIILFLGKNEKLSYTAFDLCFSKYGNKIFLW